MTQAVNAPTTTRARFAPAKRRSIPTDLQNALSVLKAHIRAFDQPFDPRIEADACHLDDWADHLDQVLEATRQYANAVISEIGRVTPGGVADETGCLADAASETVAALRAAAESRRLDNAA